MHEYYLGEEIGRKVSFRAGEKKIIRQHLPPGSGLLNRRGCLESFRNRNSDEIPLAEENGYQLLSWMLTRDEKSWSEE